MKLSFKEDRLIWDTPPGAPVSPEAQAAETPLDKFKKEGFKSPGDGSSYDPDTGMYTRRKNDSQMPNVYQVLPEEALKFRSTDAVPFKLSADAVKAKADAEKVAAEAARDKAAKDAKMTAGEGIAKAHSIVELDALKNKLGTNMDSLGKTFSLEGSPISGRFLFQKGSEFTGAKENMRNNFGRSFTPEKVAAATKILNANLDVQQGEAQYKELEVSNLLIALYTDAAVKSLQNSFTSTYKNYVGFRNNLTPEKTYNFTYDLAIDKNSVFNCTVKPDPDPSNTFLVEYTSYDKMNKLPVELTPSEVKLNERAKAFKSSGVGRFLSAMGVINVGVAVEGETQAAAEARETQAYADALKGNNFIAQFFIYFMGGSAMLADGGAAVSEAISGLDPKFQAVVKSIDAKVPKMMAKMAADPKYMTPADELEAARTESVDKAKFVEMTTDASKIPDKNLKLKEEVNADGLTVILPEGAEMIIKMGKAARVSVNGGESNAVDTTKGDVSLKGKLVVSGNLPEGTVIKGKVEFKTAEQKAADGKKPDAEKAAKVDAAKSAS